MLDSEKCINIILILMILFMGWYVLNVIGFFKVETKEDDNELVCVIPDEEFCNQFPGFSPWCDKYAPDIDIDCPTMCRPGGMVYSDESLQCYSKAGCDARHGPNGNWDEDGPFDQCNNKVLEFCERAGCKWTSCRDPDNYCLPSCTDIDPDTGKSLKDCFMSVDGTPDINGKPAQCALWDTDNQRFNLDLAPDDKKELLTACNAGLERAAGSCSSKYGCDWASVCDTSPSPDPPPGPDSSCPDVCSQEIQPGKMPSDCFKKVDGNDPCDAWDTDTLNFDLSKVTDPTQSAKLGFCNNLIDQGCNKTNCGDEFTCKGSDPKPPPPADDCVKGQTFSSNGKEPCEACDTCGDLGIKTECMPTTNTECNDPSPPPATCSGDCDAYKLCFIKDDGTPTASCAGAAGMDGLWNGTNFDTSGPLWDMAGKMPDPNDKTNTKTLQDSIISCNEGLKTCNVAGGCEWATCNQTTLLGGDAGEWEREELPPKCFERGNCDEVCSRYGGPNECEYRFGCIWKEGRCQSRMREGWIPGPSDDCLVYNRNGVCVEDLHAASPPKPKPPLLGGGGSTGPCFTRKGGCDEVCSMFKNSDTCYYDTGCKWEGGRCIGIL